MSILRYDPAHRSEPARTGRSRRSPRAWPREDAGERTGTAEPSGDGRRARPGPGLSVVVPARDEADAIGSLVEEVARTLRPLCDGRVAGSSAGDRWMAHEETEVCQSDPAGPVRSGLSSRGTEPVPSGRGTGLPPARDRFGLADGAGPECLLLSHVSRPTEWRSGIGARQLGGFEIIVVDDGSTDGTPGILEELAADYPELRVILLRPGVGQSSATVAGIRAARGEWIATLDADLQNDPADLVRLWEALPGYDVALGWREVRHDTWSRRAISQWANRVRNAVLGQSIRDTGCSVRIFRREMALRLPAFRGVHRFLGPLLLREGCRLVQVPVGHRPRPHGRSHYNIWNRSIQVVVDLIGVAWLLRRPIEFRVAEAWDAAAPASSGMAHGVEPVGAGMSSWSRRRAAEG